MKAPAKPDDALVDMAERMADAAREVILRHYRTHVAVDDKPDSSPVTVADREAERAMRDLVAETFPEQGVIGEEFGSDRPDEEYVWVLDPIDGTKQFITGKPTFGTLVALIHHGRPVVGIIDIPAMGERWTGAWGRPSVHADARGRRAVRTRPCESLDRATLCTTSPDLFAGDDYLAFQRLKAGVKLPMYGGDCFNYGLLASGFCDVVTDATMDYYDYAALVPVVEGAGGVITEASGAALSGGSGITVVAAGNDRLHEAAVAAMAG